MNAGDSSVGSIMAAMVYQIEEQNKDAQMSSTACSSGEVFSQIEGLFTRVAFDHAALETDFKKTFSTEKVCDNLPNPRSSPYQTVLSQDNTIA